MSGRKKCVMQETFFSQYIYETLYELKIGVTMTPKGRLISSKLPFNFIYLVLSHQIIATKK